MHGWPGNRTDNRELVPLLSVFTDVIVPAPPGFEQSDRHLVKLPLFSGLTAEEVASMVGLSPRARRLRAFSHAWQRRDIEHPADPDP